MNGLLDNTFLAPYRVKELKYTVTDLKKELAVKAAEQTETATLELGELCERYLSALSVYEHCFALVSATAKAESERR